MASNSRTRATPSRIDVAERERDALELWKAGETFDEIARQLGSAERGGAAKAVSRALWRRRFSTQPTSCAPLKWSVSHIRERGPHGCRL